MNLLSPQTQARVEHLVDVFRHEGAAVLISSTDLANDEACLLVIPAEGQSFHLRVSDRLRYDRDPAEV